MMKFAHFMVFILLFQQVGYQPVSLNVTYNGQVISRVNRSEFSKPYLGEPIIDIEKLNQFMERIDKLVYKEPLDATLDQHFRIVPEKAGQRLSKHLFTEKFYSFMASNQSANMEVPLLSVHPRVTSELLADIRVQQIGNYMTYYNSNNKERSHNIQLAAKAINNAVIFPGETFSFNKVVGKRTKERGYLPAPVIVKGELSEGIGGGICQVSSTLYNAVDRAGVKIVERYSHSRSVPYVPPGRDATVSWYGPDFSFKNTYHQPILIRTKAIQGKVIIKIYSSEAIHVKPKDVPSAPDDLPKEVKIDDGLNTNSTK